MIDLVSEMLAVTANDWNLPAHEAGLYWEYDICQPSYHPTTCAK